MAEGGDTGQDSPQQMAALPQPSPLVEIEVPNNTDVEQLLQFRRENWKAFLKSKELPMTDKQKQHLNQHRKDFVSRVDVIDIVDYLFGDGVLSDEEHEQILHRKELECNEEGMRKLLSVLCRKGQKAYFSLLRALYLSTSGSPGEFENGASRI